MKHEIVKHVIPKRRWLAGAVAAVALLTASAWASAAPMRYMTNFTTLNDSGVTGSANVTLDGDMLTVHINATGLLPNQVHVQHIHGTFDGDGNPSQAVTPTLAAVDANGDGIIELLEGAMTYGAILVPLTPFSMTPDGTLDFTHVYDLSDSSIYAAGFGRSDLFPLSFREIVLHGLNAPFALTDAGVDYMAGQYVPTLPVASGVLVGVPEPGELGLMGGGLALLFGFMWLRRRTDCRPALA